MDDKVWLSLMIGNSRLHWAALARDQVLETWDSSHLGQNTDVSAMAGQDSKTAEDVAVEEEGIPSLFLSPTARELLLDETSTKEATKIDQIETDGRAASARGNKASGCLRLDPRRFRIASVVPKELALWLRRCPGVQPIVSRDVLTGVEGYATLGVDRALAVRGAARVSGWPVVVVDCGTALTFTAGDKNGTLGGGAILPGVRLQLAALGTRTAQLPSDVRLPQRLPPRWAMSTSGGIQAGVMWTIVAGIQSFINDRWKVEPDATVVFTGGDGQVLHKAVWDSWEGEEPARERARDRLKHVEEVIHWGIASLAFGGVEPSG